MSTYDVQPGDTLSATQKPAIVVQVDELAVSSPTAEAAEVLSRSVEVGKTATVTHQDDLNVFAVPVVRSRTNGITQGTLAMSASSIQRSSSHEGLWRSTKVTGDYGDGNSPSRRRAMRMQLPSFRSLGIASSDSEYFGRRPPPDRHSGLPERPSPQPGRAAAQSLPLRPSENSRPLPHAFGNTPLLTPPEDADSIKWNNALLYSPQHPHGGEPSGPVLSASHVMATSQDSDGQTRPPPNTTQTGDGFEAQARHADLGSEEGNAEQDADQSPLSRAIRSFISRVLRPETTLENIHIIAQILPQPALDASNSKPAFEEVVEFIQHSQNSDNVAYITLTHAVPPKFEMKDLPTSPPATPNVSQGRNDYFGQIIFNNAATVSTYHGHKSLINSQAPASPNTIVAPSSINLSILERYIPPTSPLEYADFFDGRSHSILVDRLAELSGNGGRLLLLYPTQRGAETFMNSYLGPVLEPLLREFIFINNVYHQLGTTLGSMTAVPDMLDFDGMKMRIASLCRAISRKATFRGGPSSDFSLIHSSKGATTIDNKTWKEWFINQELTRIKENLLDYAKAGGRMPPEVNHYQLTPSVLARQIVHGVQESTQICGGVPIELGLFVIERTRN